MRSRGELSLAEGASSMGRLPAGTTASASGRLSPGTTGSCLGASTAAHGLSSTATAASCVGSPAVLLTMSNNIVHSPRVSRQRARLWALRERSGSVLIGYVERKLASTL